MIVSQMLSSAVNGVGKSAMMYKVGLSSAQVNRYLELLLKLRLLTVCNENKRCTYKTTTKGKSFLETFDTIIKPLD